MLRVSMITMCHDTEFGLSSPNSWPGLNWCLSIHGSGVVWLPVIQIDLNCSLLPTTTIHIKIKTQFLVGMVYCYLLYDSIWCQVGTLFFHLMTWYTMWVLSVLHFQQRWYITYPTTRPGVESVLSLFSSNYLVHDAGTISAGIFCEHTLVAWRVLHRLVEWHWDERLIEAIEGHDHQAPLGQPHSDDFNMMHFCHGLMCTPPSMLCFDCNDTSSTFEPHL